MFAPYCHHLDADTVIVRLHFFTHGVDGRVGTQRSARYLFLSAPSCVCLFDLHQDDSASTPHLDTPNEPHRIVPSPVAPLSAGTSTSPTCADPFANNFNELSPRGGPDPAKPPLVDREPPPSLLKRRPTRQFSTGMAQTAGAPLRNLMRFPRPKLGPSHQNPAERHPHRVRRCPFHVIYRLWPVLPLAARDFGPARRPAGELSPLPRESYRRQTNGRYFGRISRGRSHVALHLVTREPRGHHTQEI